MKSWQEQEQEVDEAVARYPKTFGLRNFPDLTFCLVRSACFYSQGRIMLYTYVERDGQWLAFAKGTEAELRREIVADPNATDTTDL